MLPITLEIIFTHDKYDVKSLTFQEYRHFTQELYKKQQTDVSLTKTPQ